MAKILVIEDETPLCKMIRDLLVSENHEVDTTDDGFDGQNRIEHGQYDVAVIDWNLPGRTGIEICKSYREIGGGTRVLMLTGNSTAQDKVVGLDAGADDYLTKPFNGPELLARIRALLRRPLGLNRECFQLDDLLINLSAHTVTRLGENITLVRKEFAILTFLAQNPNRVFSAEALVARVWPSETDATVEALCTSISRLRKKIDIPGKPSLITTVHGVGYKLTLPASNSAT